MDGIMQMRDKIFVTAGEREKGAVPEGEEEAPNRGE